MFRKRDNGLVKIITGVRRCGKSYLLFKLFRTKLIESGVAEDHIVALALDDFSNRKYLNPEELYNYLKGRITDNGKYIGTPMKYYFVDVGLRNARLNFRQQEENHIMENIIYNELLRRRYSVDIGVVSVNEKKDEKYIKKQLEIDFIANKGDKRYYIQSAYEISNEEKLKQELQSFRNIDDSFKKIIIQRTAIKPWINEQGVLYMSIVDFLLNPNSLDI